MKCSEVEKQIDSLLDDDVNFVIKEELERHLKECLSCGRNHEKLQAINKVLLNIVPAPDPKRIDARVMKAFRRHHNKQPETKKATGWWAAIAGFGAMPKTALSIGGLLFAVSVGSAFYLGRITATDVQITLPQTNNVVQQAALNEKVEPTTRAETISGKVDPPTVTKFIKVPVIKEKVVSRIVYVTDAKERKPENENTSTIRARNNLALKNSMQKNEFLTETELKGFQPVSDSKIRIIKEGVTNED